MIDQGNMMVFDTNTLHVGSFLSRTKMAKQGIIATRRRLFSILKSKNGATNTMR